MKKLIILVSELLSVCFAAGALADEPYNPVAAPEAVVIVGSARFTILTPVLIRMEWSSEGRFEDRASQAFINRNLPVPKFDVSKDGAETTIRTAELSLHYQSDGGRFSTDNLRIEFDLNERLVTWTPGTTDAGNLLGTWRTLDGVSGASSLEPGLMSRDGWTLVDDSTRLVFENGYPSWITPRENKDAIDWYFFGYGHDYKRLLRDYIKVAGRIPLPPRFVFGAWWSRYWAYSDQELKDLVGQFREHDVPLDVLVIDMDWHLDGWTGYTWNPKYFSDPRGFLKWVHEQGLRATLNLHPAEGVGKHEKVFPEVCQAMGLDPEKTERVPFDCADPDYMDAYFNLVHRPLEKQGVDFWWIDWQQGAQSKMPGLDPLGWLNHLHWWDLQRRAEETGRRPILFSRWGGLGGHRYQIGFSGDTYSNWSSLAFQPFFTSTAGNVGYGYWSHDIGGHMSGVVEPEVYTRWIQWGIFSPVLRTHTTKNPKAERRIWAFPEETFLAARAAFHLRYELIPYIYTSAWECYDAGLPLCRPLYYEWPELEEAYTHGGEYLFGEQLLVAPVTEPRDSLSGCAQVRVWLPPGEWTNWFTGRTYKGPADVRLLVPLDEIPVFVRSGGIIAAQPKMRHTGEKPVDPLILHIWPGESGKTRVYEDDGESQGYTKDYCAWTPVSHRTVDGERHITVDAVVGSFPGRLKERGYEIRLRDVWPAQSVTVDGQSLPTAKDAGADGWSYDQQTMSVVIRLPKRPVSEKSEVVVIPHPDVKDEKALRSGLRGQLTAIKAAMHLLGDTPAAKSLAEALAIQESRETAPVRRAESAATIQRGWLDFVAEIAQEKGVSDDAHRRALVRMLGLYYQVHAAAEGEAGEKLVAEVEVASTLGLPSLAGVSGEITLATDEPWRLEGQDTWKVSDLPEAKPLKMKAGLVCDGAFTTGVLRADIAIQKESAKVAVRIEDAFLPSINSWWMIGPFDSPRKEKLDKIFPPEREIDLKATYEGKDGKTIGWRKVQRKLGPGANLREEFAMNFDEVFEAHYDDVVMYAFAYLEAPQDMDAVLAIGSDDGVAAWLNGKEVHRNPTPRPYLSKEDRVPAKLKKGTNTLLVKVQQGGGGWGLGVHVEDADGHPLPQVRAGTETAGSTAGKKRE